MDVCALSLGRSGAPGKLLRAELDAWAQKLAPWRLDVEVYAYFNNDWEGFAVRNAAGLLRRLS